MADTWVPEYMVRLNGRELPQADDAHLQAITVELRRQAPASVELQFNNHEGAYDTRDDLGPGAKAEVSLGYTDGGPKRVFEGEIIGTRVRLAENGPRVFVAQAFDAVRVLSRRASD